MVKAKPRNNTYGSLGIASGEVQARPRNDMAIKT